jgi:type III secretion protein U
MSEKSYKPTPRRLREARKRGEVARSRELSSMASFIALWTCLWFGAGDFWKRLARIVDHVALATDPVVGVQPWQDQAWSMLLDALWVILPLLGVSVAFAVLVGGLQTRGMISMETITPKFERINPGQVLRNLFTVRQLLELAKMLVKTVLLLGLLGYFICISLGTIVTAVYAPVADVLRMGSVLVWRLMGWAAVIYAVTAVLDYAHQFYEFMKKQKMSIEELRRDLQETEGNPHIKNRRRSLRRELIFSHSSSRMAPVSVVVVNPTHVAVALYYKAGKTPLPRVVAKGADAMALHIRAQAERDGVPVREDRALARRLFREVAVDHYIKEELIDAVAAVFRWVRLLEESRQTSVELGVAEAESDATDRVNQLGEVGLVDLAAQTRDVHVDNVVERGGSPDVFPDLMR